MSSIEIGFYAPPEFALFSRIIQSKLFTLSLHLGECNLGQSICQAIGYVLNGLAGVEMGKIVAGMPALR